MAKADKPNEVQPSSKGRAVVIMNPDETPEGKILTAQVEPAVAEKDGTNTKSTAKAGKRSKKALEEAEVRAEKEERKKSSTAPTASKGVSVPKKPTRSKSERKGKKYREAYKLIDKTRAYPLQDALELAQKTNTVKFDASVELHINLNVDPRQADQNIRGNLVLPHGTGKSIRVAVFDDTKTDADLSGVETITKQLEKSEINFDVLISTPQNMAKLGKYARLLGPRGLMPNPKSGTVTADVAKAVAEAKAGKIVYRVDSTGIAHVIVGKVSFKPDQLLANAEALLKSVRNTKPASVKSNFIKSIHVATTMGPSIKVQIDT